MLIEGLIDGESDGDKDADGETLGEMLVDKDGEILRLKLGLMLGESD